MAAALDKLSSPRPSPSTPSPGVIKRSLSGTSTETDPAYSTPIAQVRRSLSQLSTADESTAEVPLQRRDSTDSAMHELLHTSDDESPDRVPYNPEHVRYSPSLLHTPSADGDISESPGSHVSNSQDSLATLPRANDTPVLSQKDELAGASPAEETSPTASVSSSSQAKEVVDVNSDNSKIEHDEYFELILEKEHKNRVLVRPSTRRPRLWRHHSATFPSLMVFSAVDDGVKLATPGILWCLQEIDQEVVLIASLGWRSYKKNSRSHKVSPSGPIYAFVRDVGYVGQPLRFSHVQKVNIHTLFVKGIPAAEVDVDDMQRSRKLSSDFVRANGSNTNSWKSITTFKFASKKAEPEPDNPPPTKRSSARIQRLEQEQKKKTDLANKIIELKAAKLKAENLAKQTKLQYQQRQRDLKRTIRQVVRETMESFKSSVDQKLKSVRGAVTKNKKKIEDTFENRLQNLSADVREGLEQELGERVKELTNRLDTLTQDLDETNSLRVKCFKKTRKMLETLQVQVSNNSKTSKKNRKKINAKGIVKNNKKKRGRQYTNENVEASAPPVPTMIARPPTPAIVNRPPTPAIVNRPPTPMVTYASDRAYTMYSSPPASTSTVSHFAPNGQQYVSPAFASRNFAR